MKALLSIVLLLTFGTGVWGFTPEQMAGLKEAAENGEVKAQWLLAYAYKDGDAAFLKMVRKPLSGLGKLRSREILMRSMLSVICMPTVTA